MLARKPIACLFASAALIVTGTTRSVAGEDDYLEVIVEQSELGNMLTLINRGDQAMEIKDITANNQVDCTAYLGIVSSLKFRLADPKALSQAESHTAWLHQHDPFVETKNGKYSAEVCRSYPCYVTNFTQVNLNTNAITLKVGVKRRWRIGSECRHVAGTTIITNLGSAGFDFGLK
jgi:hypothetical protein